MTEEKMAKDKLIIRSMKPEDIAAVLDIDHKIGGGERAATYVTADLGGELALSFVAEIGGKIVGFILARHSYAGEPTVETGFIQAIGVDHDYRRQGIATKLVNHFLEHCKSRGLKTVRVTVKEYDSQLKGFFQCLDFSRGQLVDYTRTL